MNRPVCGKTRVNVFLLAALGIIAVYLLSLIGLRGFVSGHLPLSNGYETMQFLALCATLLTFIFYRKSEAVIAFGYMLCGLALLVAMLGEANPPITQLMPVLASPLLSLHVVTIMIAYSLTAFIMLNGIMAIVLRYIHKDYQDAVVRLQVMSRLILYPAVFCLAGTRKRLGRLSPYLYMRQPCMLRRSPHSVGLCSFTGLPLSRF